MPYSEKHQFVHARVIDRNLLIEHLVLEHDALNRSSLNIRSTEQLGTEHQLCHVSKPQLHEPKPIVTFPDNVNPLAI